ncbi:MAG: RNA polymerase sigma factor [Deltaproteobacteria bacterium]|nr:RNA polymerase sigma factor [Deltaproteobacteria bacterium]
MDKFREFYNKHRDKLFNYLMRMSGDYELARDLMQESFTRYLEHYRGKTQNISLLYTIARNAFFDNQRKRERERQIALNGEEEDQSRDQEQIFLVREEYRRVLSAMHHLGNTERDTLALVISGDLSYREIASITGMSEANVKVKVHRARNNLRKILYKGGE